MNTNYFQLKDEFIKLLLDNNNIYNILIGIHKMINYNCNILKDIDIKLLKNKENDNSMLFKYCYITKVFSGINLIDMYYYHNCIIFLSLCNNNRLVLKKLYLMKIYLI